MLGRNKMNFHRQILQLVTILNDDPLQVAKLVGLSRKVGFWPTVLQRVYNGYK